MKIVAVVNGPSEKGRRSGFIHPSLLDAAFSGGSDPAPGELLRGNAGKVSSNGQNRPTDTS